jgi:undecaprenyl phosphate N,N'-diacetylbacillosamine 1-phosphate transferase
VKTLYVQYGKRVGDLMFCLLFITVFAWLYMIIFATLILTLNTPIFYQSKRIGKNGKTFSMYKFRTLTTDVSLPLNNRQFMIGQVLRFTNLDELPQVWNVLVGQMSWIGPRPLPVEYRDKFTVTQFKRHNVLPGITGLAQVNGKNELIWPKKFEWDLQYIDNLSLLLDLKILVRTAVLIFSFKKDVSLTEQEF